MSESVLIGNVTKLKAFEPAIKLQAISEELRDRYLQDYILTQDLADVYFKILSSIVGEGWGSTTSTLPAERRRSHLITAQYGAGKSYFLMILAALVEAASNPAKLGIARSKFQRFTQVHGLLSRLEDKKFLIIRISAEDKGDIGFKELVVSSLLREVSKILPDAAFDNEYTEALRHLEELELSQVGALLAQVLEEQFGTSVQQLRGRLGLYDRDGLRIYYQAWERTVGRPISRTALEVETTYQQALDLLKPEGYTHIVVLIDEMTAYLRASASHHSLAETLGELQAFGAYCNKPASRCLFVGAMHVSMLEFLQDWSQQRDYEKMKGRFDEHEFPIYSNKLLAGVFEPDEGAFARATRSYRGQLTQLGQLIQTLKITDNGQPMGLAAFFPLHPAVVRYLPLVSRELGQAERTSFGFIDEVVRSKLDEPLVKGDQLNLVTLDQVFDYFMPAMGQRPYYQQVITAYNAVQSKAAVPLAHRIFKSLALLWIASRVHSGEAQYLGFDLSVEQATSYVCTTDEGAVAKALEALCQTSYVYLDRSTQKYFYTHADPGWDLESEISKEMVSVDANEVLRSELQALGSRVCLRAPETLSVKVERNLESQWLEIRQLQETASLKPKRAEGKVGFVVPDLADVDRYHAIFSDVTQKARNLSAPNVAVAIPRRVDMLNPAELKRYRALQVIGKRLDVSDPASVSEHRIRVTHARFAEVQERVQRDLEAFGQASNFIFFVNRQPMEAQDATTILIDMFELYYYKFPKVKAERISGRSTTNALIDNCIVNQQTTFAGDTSEVARQARDTLQVLGLCSWQQMGGGKYKVELKEPEPGSEAYEIWKIVLDTLGEGSKTPFETLYKRLGDAPFGLPYYMVELYIAAARALNKVYILDSSNRMQTPSKTLVADITKQKDKGFRVQPVEKSEVPYVYISALWQAIDEPLGLRYYQDLEKSLGRAIDDQKIWFAFKQDSNNLLQNRLAQVRDNLGVVGAESQPLAILIEHLERIRPIFIPAQGFKELAALGEALSGKKVSVDPDGGAHAVRGVIGAVKQFLEEWPVLQPAHRQYRRLQSVADLDRFGDVSRTVAAAWQDYASDALSAEKWQVFIHRFQELWEQYAEAYVEEHNAVAKARADYGRDVEKSLAFEVLGEISLLALPGVTTKSSFEARIQETREKSCRKLTKDAVRDYRQFEEAACSSCSYRLGTIAQVVGKLQESEKSLAASVSNALDSYLAKLDDLLCSETIQLYIREQASADEKSDTALLCDLTRRRDQLSEPQYRKFKALLPQLRSVVPTAQAYAREQARKSKELEKRLEEEERKRRIPRLATARLGDEARRSLLDSGLETMTLEELKAWLAAWLDQIAEEFKPKA